MKFEAFHSDHQAKSQLVWSSDEVKQTTQLMLLIQILKNFDWTGQK